MTEENEEYALSPKKVNQLSHRAYRDHGSIGSMAAMVASKLTTELKLVDAGDVEEDFEADEDAFSRNRPQEGFIRLPMMVVTECPEKPDHQIYWYAACVTATGEFYLEGARAENAFELAAHLAAHDRQSSGDLPVNDEGNVEMPNEDAGTAVAVVPQGVDGPLFRKVLADETFSGIPSSGLAKFVMLAQWGMHTHPDYIRCQQASQEWTPSSAEGLYPGGPGGAY